MKTRFIVNPHSGGATRVLDQVQAFAADMEADVAFTAGPRHATELAGRAIADGCGLIVAVGGDGTMNEIAARLVSTPATLGLVPCGSGNGLGRHLGIHGKLTRVLDILREGRTRLIDTGLADGHPFFTVAGLGFEAEVAARFNALTTRGFTRYVTTSARAWRQHRSERCRISGHGQSFEADVFTLAVANSDQYGNNAVIAPGARIDDGLLDLTVIPPVSALRALPMLVQLFTGTLQHAPGVVRVQAAHLVVERSSPGLIHTDGETHPAGTRVEFHIRPRALRVMAPPVDDVELLPIEPELSTPNPFS